jgi:two-component system, LytTR family, response regulator
MTLRAVIIDDEIHSLQTTEMLVKKYCPEISVEGLADTPEKGIELIDHCKPDLVFLDIAMPGMNGFELLSHVNFRFFEIIFTTAFDEYAIKAFKVNAIDYLLKPIETDELIEAVKKVQRKFDASGYKHQVDDLIKLFRPDSMKRRIAFSVDGKIRLFDPETIIYFQSDGNYTQLHLTGNQKFLVSKTLKSVEQHFNHPVFIRIHNSFLINLNHIKEYIRGEGGEVVMSNGDTLPVSRSKKEELLEMIFSGTDPVSNRSQV